LWKKARHADEPKRERKHQKWAIRSQNRVGGFNSGKLASWRKEKMKAANLSTERRLNELPTQRCSVVCRVETDSEDMRRLKTLGICVGRRIEVIKTGDPMIVRVFGSRLGMSAALASRVWLEVCTPAHCALRETPEL
jgi:ferrous iron transport protein A